jgi:type I restriction enzyme R subunit
MSDTPNKKSFNEQEICTKYVTPALTAAGWDLIVQIREQVAYTKGRIKVRGKLHSRGEVKKPDYVLYYQPNLPIAIIEAKDCTQMLLWLWGGSCDAL